uniref:N-acyl-aromatic-L-amino acid amidohydrolase n=1 Tax=Poecilia latipinna TaxID=48699 RepID=A0A3B3V238_9TELE
LCQMQVDEPVRLPRLSRAAVCGGTHGNELSGVYLVREMLKPENRKEDGGPASLLMLLSNPRAVQQCTRYVDTDLNRCFTHATLNGPASEGAPYEIFRARELNNLLGPKGSRAAVDLICDLHNTTANMGLCFIAYSDCDWVCLHIFRHLQKQMPDTPMRFIHFDVSTKESYSLDSIGKHGFGEFLPFIGPQPHGCIKSNIYTAMREGVQHMRDWVSCFNSGESNVSMAQLPVCRGFKTSKCFLSQDRDFCLLRPGEPLFQTFSGETVKYQGAEALYAFFINECAYYKKGIALSLARKRRVSVPSIPSVSISSRFIYIYLSM